MHNIKYFFLLLIAGFLLSSCEKNDNTVIDPVIKIPTITFASVTPSNFDTMVIHMLAYARVQSDDPIQGVSVKVVNPDGVQVSIVELRDDGIAPDTTLGDKNYTGYIDFTLDCRMVGQYSVEFYATTTTGSTSNQYVVNCHIINSHDQKPSLSNLIAPDSLLKPTTGTTVIFLQVTATDPDGQCDLPSNCGVFFNSYKPDGNPASGNPYCMYDDGDETNHCDQTGHDGNYSLCIKIDSSAQIGIYNFKFNAKDRSGLLSDTLVHQIYVHQ